MVRTTDALELLTLQHEEITTLLQELLLVGGSERARLLVTLADKLTTHLVVEADLLYPRIRDLAPVDELLAEHAEIRRVVGVLLLTRPDATDHLIGELCMLLRGHTGWQEDELFERVARAMSPGVLAMLGAELGTRSAASLCLAA